MSRWKEHLFTVALWLVVVNLLIDIREQRHTSLWIIFAVIWGPVVGGAVISALLFIGMVIRNVVKRRKAARNVVE